jgi:hypothetical protein
MTYANGKREIVPPPKDIVILRRDQVRPDLRRWQTLVPRAVVLALLAAISGLLKKVLSRRQRLSGSAPPIAG